MILKVKLPCACELCDDNAVGIFKRTWESNEVDDDLPLCQSCKDIVPNGMYTLKEKK